MMIVTSVGLMMDLIHCLLFINNDVGIVVGRDLMESFHLSSISSTVNLV